MDKNKYIAGLLVNASNEIILKPRLKWLEYHHPNKKLIFRVGSGKKTYHCRKTANLHSITYGSKMIDNKLRSKHVCSQWTTGREIIQRKYFQGNLTIQTALAHTVLHEMGHFFQVLNGGRTRGSVHNEYFYKVLDKMHNSESPTLLLDYLNEDSIFRNLDFSTEYIPPKQEFNKNNIILLDKVLVRTRDGSAIFTVLKKNSKTFKGEYINGRVFNIYYQHIIKRI